MHYSLCLALSKAQVICLVIIHAQVIILRLAWSKAQDTHLFLLLHTNRYMAEINEPPHGKTNNLHGRKRFALIVKLISAFVFTTRIVQLLFFLNSKFQAFYLLLQLYSLVCVGPGQKLKLLLFSCTGSNI